MTEQPFIDFENEKFYVTGCEFCECENWIIGSNGKDFIAKCSNCGHKVKLKQESLRNKPKYQIFDARFFT